MTRREPRGEDDTPGARSVMTRRARHRLVGGLIVMSIVLVVYARTLYPGLVLFGDSPKFQFVGRIWGTPHNPGYPLYLVVSHVFGWLPFGTLAYRINLMSAVCGAVASGLMVLLVGRLTGRVWAGVAVALALAFGNTFWSQAIVAEVYTLATVLLLATVLCAVRWTETRRPRDLLASVLLASVAVGNHLTIVIFAPGLIVLALLTDWRRVLAPRIVAIMAALIAAGLSQYLLLIYFTSRHPPYLESSARNLSELVRIVAGTQFQNRFGHFGWHELFTTRSAQLFRMLLDETGTWGMAAAGCGGIVLLRRRPAVATGLAVSALSVWLFALCYDVPDSKVFLIPVIVVLWTFAGVAVGAIIDVAARTGRIAAIVAGLASAVAGGTLCAVNYKANDHHRRTYEMTLMDAVFRALPEQAVLVPGGFSEQLMLAYKIDGERAGADRAISQHPLEPAWIKGASADGRPIYVFPAGRDQLSRSGFFFEPVALLDVTLNAYLAAAPANLVVAIAGPGLGAALPPAGPSFPEIGATAALFTHARDSYAVIGRTGGQSGALEKLGSGPVEVENRELPERLRAVGSSGGTITYGDKTIVASDFGAVVAVFTPAGHLVRASVLDQRELRLAIEGEAGEAALFRVTGYRECHDIANSDWVDVSAVTSAARVAVRVDNYRPFTSHLWLVIGRDIRANTRLLSFSGPGTPGFDARTFATSDAAGVQQALAAAGFGRSNFPASRFIEVVHVWVNDDGAFELLTLDLGTTPAFGFARGTADLNNPKRLTVCAGDSG